jgi:glycine cleavage system H lipoate-binding protein
MNCPYLRETRVRYCRRSPQRKLIPRVPVGSADERCSTEAFRDCPFHSAEGGNTAGAPPCPLLDESLMQYCAASSVVRLVQYSDAPFSQCGSSRFRYCDLYLELTHPAMEAAGKAVAYEDGLLYTTNHWWVNLPAEGACHLGLDAFAARLIGEATHIDYVTQGSPSRPVVVVTAGGTNWQVVFPERVYVVRCNLYLRAHPARLLHQPYTGGWLFEAELPPEAGIRLRRDCRTSRAAEAWLEQETRRVTERLQHGMKCAADGGVFSAGVVPAVAPEDGIALFHEFLSPVAAERGEQ